MQLYRTYIPDDLDFPVRWSGTQNDAKAPIKPLSPEFRSEVVVEMVEVNNDKATLLAALNGEPVRYDVITHWRGTSRGGLRDPNAPIL